MNFLNLQRLISILQYNTERDNPMESFQSPSTCASCGSPKVASTWVIRKRQDHFSAWTFLTMPFGVSTTRRTTYTFEMPVCRKCKEKLDGIDKISTGINYASVSGGGGIAAIGLLALMAMGDTSRAWTVYALLAVFGAVVGAYFGGILGKVLEWAIKYVMVYDFCNFDGRYFRFDNQKFEHEFALLNPGWVKPKRKSR
ncbi:MAG: hypothetical protein AB1564_07175 [Chloroflexota bacterium]